MTSYSYKDPHFSNISVRNKDGTALNMWTLSDSRRLAYIEKQTSYVEYGVASACLKAIATHASNIEANLADEVQYTLSLACLSYSMSLVCFDICVILSVLSVFLLYI